MKRETAKKKKKTAKTLAQRKAYPVRMEAITSRKTRIYKEKKKTIFETEKRKKRREVGRRYPGPNH